MYYTQSDALAVFAVLCTGTIAGAGLAALIAAKIAEKKSAHAGTWADRRGNSARND